MSERPTEYRFEFEKRRVGIVGATIDMSRNALVSWIVQLTYERDRLQAVVDAAEAAGPWPLLRQEDFIDGDWYLECFHCGRDNANSGGSGEIEHKPDCRGVVLREALTAVTRGNADDA